jgi:hypothetical protein
LISGAVLLAACSNGGGDDAANHGGGTGATGGATAGSGAAGGGTGGTGGMAGDDSLVVPEGVTILTLDGGTGVLELFALTLSEQSQGLEGYAAVRNIGTAHACSAALSLELYDTAEQSLGAGIGSLLTEGFFQLTDGSGTIAACVEPGAVAMAVVRDFPASIALASVAFAVYRTPYFELPVEPIVGLSVNELERVPLDAGTAYTGTFVNGFDIAVTNPTVTIFPVNGVGRPLGAAIGSDALEIPAGGSWTFITNAATDLGVSEVAFPVAALAR